MFYAARPALGVQASALQPQARVLVIAPHPDDEVVGCGGVLLEHARLGDRTTALIVTDGRDSRATGQSPQATAALRRRETEAAAKKLSLSELRWADLPERGWAPAEAAAHIEAALESAQPEVVYAPSRIDGHPVHFSVAKACALALTSRPDVRVRIYQAQVMLTPLLTNRAYDISSVWPQLLEVFACYRSQLGAIERLQRPRRYEAHMRGAKIAVEVFWEMSGARYCALHEEPVDRYNGAAFFGPKEGAFRDPLAYLQGRRARRALKEKAKP